MNDQCPGITKSGDPCGAKPFGDSVYCIWHDPARAAQRAENNRAGGQARSSTARAAKLIKSNCYTLGEVNDLLKLALLEVSRGKMEPKVGTAMATLAGRIMALTIGVELADRVANLTQEGAELRGIVTEINKAVNE